MSKYDDQTGQVFKESIMPRAEPAFRNGRDWSRRTDLPSWRGRSGKGQKGPRGLTEMAIHIIADNIGDVTEEHLQRDELPARYLWRIWRLLENRGACLQAWKVLSKFLLAEGDEKTLNLYRYRHHICRPTEQLAHYTRPLNSTSFDFISYLNIGGNCSFGENELLALADMKNLGALEIIQPADELRVVFPRISDRLIKGWSLKDNPFPLLRILRLWGDESATEQSLQYVSKFPSLVLYDVNVSRSDWSNAISKAKENGWEMADLQYGLQDSLLRYLMLFTSVDESKPKQLRELARNIDEGLINFCQNTSQILDFIPHGDAPPFLDHIGDTAKSNQSMYVDAPSPSYEARTCKGFPYETWAFCLYAFLGQVALDADLKKAGLPVKKQAVSGQLVLPSRPLACLQLGHSGRVGTAPAVSYVRRGLFATSRYTFYRSASGPVRPSEATGLWQPSTIVHQVETAMVVNRQKRQRMDDLLRSLHS